MSTTTPRTEPSRETQQQSSSERRTRPRVTEQIQIIRELWLLREQARVQAAERRFLTELERLLSGGPYSSSSSPPPPSFTSTISSSSNVTATTSTATPEAPPLPPNGGFHLATSPLFVSDGMVFESHPPPRGAHAPAREVPDAVSQEMEQARASQRVTNLSAQFRARLEGNENEDDDEDGHQRTNEYTQDMMMYPGVVSSVLDSQFRHRLERVLHQRNTTAAATGTTPNHHLHPQNLPPSSATPQVNEVPGGGGGVRGEGSESMHSVVAALRDEVNMLKNVVNASFDIQLDIQRSIRQEVAAAMNSPPTLSVLQQKALLTHTSSSTDVQMLPSSASSSTSTAQNNQALDVQQRDLSASSSKVMKAGICVVCLENNIDALLYACGHMCTCSACGRQLLASGLCCPICRAPVRDVVRAYVVTE